jgi:hypothetical protein
MMDHPNIARVFDAGARSTAAILRHGAGARGEDHGLLR